MGFTRKTADDIVEVNNGSKLREKGWYQLAVSNYEVKDAKSTQKYLNLAFKVCSEEGNPDSISGAPIFYMTMFSDIEDEDKFLQVLEEKESAKGNATDGDTLRAIMKKRKAQADESAARDAFALFGYDQFSQVPRKDKESGEYLLADGTVVSSYEERKALYNARTAEGVNAMYDVAEGVTDITKYLVYGKVDVETWNGQERNVIKSLKPALPDGEKLVKLV